MLWDVVIWLRKSCVRSSLKIGLAHTFVPVALLMRERARRWTKDCTLHFMTLLWQSKRGEWGAKMWGGGSTRQNFQRISYSKEYHSKLFQRLSLQLLKDRRLGLKTLRNWAPATSWVEISTFWILISWKIWEKKIEEAFSISSFWRAALNVDSFQKVFMIKPQTFIEFPPKTPHLSPIYHPCCKEKTYTVTTCFVFQVAVNIYMLTIGERRYLAAMACDLHRAPVVTVG